VRKVSAGEYDAFDSPNCAPLGVLGVETRFDDGLTLKGRPRLEHDIDPRVFLLKVFPGLDPAAVLPVLDSVRGLVVEAHGSGNFPISRESGRSLLPIFQQARKKRIPVVVVSQAHRNGVDLSLYEAGQAALDIGALSGGDMTSAAAVVKLMHALARGGDLSALRSYMLRNVAGERTP
jgi:L-asparaginase